MIFYTIQFRMSLFDGSKLAQQKDMQKRNKVKRIKTDLSRRERMSNSSVSTWHGPMPKEERRRLK